MAGVYDTKNIKLGVCRVSFGGVDLGYTKGGVDVSITTDTHEVNVDQYGDAPVNDIITSRRVEVTVPLAETTLENAISIMPGAYLVTDKEDATKRRIEVTTSIGTSLIDIAQELVLHPVTNESWEREDDFVLYKCATSGSIEFSYKHDEEKIYPVKFKGYTDDRGRLFAMGDITATA